MAAALVESGDEPVPTGAAVMLPAILRWGHLSNMLGADLWQ
jgi:hypothetical protein